MPGGSPLLSKPCKRLTSHSAPPLPSALENLTRGRWVELAERQDFQFVGKFDLLIRVLSHIGAQMYFHKFLKLESLKKADVRAGFWLGLGFGDAVPHHWKKQKLPSRREAPGRVGD